MSKPITCKFCKRKICLKTRVICKKMDLWLKKNIEKSFWHGNHSFGRLDNLLYSIVNEDDMTEF